MEVGIVIYDYTTQQSDAWGVLPSGKKLRLTEAMTFTNQVLWFEVQNNPYGYGFNPLFFGCNLSFINTFFSGEIIFGIRLELVKELNRIVSTLPFSISYDCRKKTLKDLFVDTAIKSSHFLSRDFLKLYKSQVDSDLSIKQPKSNKPSNLLTISSLPPMAKLGEISVPVSEIIETRKDLGMGSAGFTMLSVKQQPVNPAWQIKSKKDRWINNCLTPFMASEFPIKFEHGFRFIECKPLKSIMPIFGWKQFSTNAVLDEVIRKALVQSLINHPTPTLIDLVMIGHLKSWLIYATNGFKESREKPINVFSHKRAGEIEIEQFGRVSVSLHDLNQYNLETVPIMLREFNDVGKFIP